MRTNRRAIAEPLTAEYLRELREVRARFGPAERRRKLRLLGAAAAKSIDDPRLLADYHEVLLFLAAYPDGPELHRRVEAELTRVAGRAAALVASSGKVRRQLDGSGIEGTDLSCEFSVHLAQWLCRTFPRDVELDWDETQTDGRLDDLLPALVPRCEADGFLSDRLDTAEWVALAHGPRGRALAWIVERFLQVGAPAVFRDRVFESMGLSIRWRLTNGRASRTFLRFASRPIFHPSGPAPGHSVLDVISRPLPAQRRLSASERDRLLGVCRATLAVRQRETDPVTYANPSEVALFSLERGIDVCLLGMLPERRLPIESFFGFVAARNRVPIGYGGGWVFFDRCEIGVNIFDTFRGGESAYVFAQIMRVYRQHFRVRRFQVDPFQFGEGNPEAIRSGAFWFYHRLGFRPMEPRYRALAEAEHRRIRAEPGYRSPPAILRRLAKSHIELPVGEGEAGVAPADLRELGLAASRWMGRQCEGDRARAIPRCAARLKKVLGVRGDGHWSTAEREAFAGLAPLMLLIPDLRRWNASQKRTLAAILRAKGGRLERRYAMLMQAHHRLREAFEAIAEHGRNITLPK